MRNLPPEKVISNSETSYEDEILAAHGFSTGSALESFWAEDVEALGVKELLGSRALYGHTITHTETNLPSNDIPSVSKKVVAESPYMRKTTPTKKTHSKKSSTKPEESRLTWPGGNEGQNGGTPYGYSPTALPSMPMIEPLPNTPAPTCFAETGVDSGGTGIPVNSSNTGTTIPNNGESDLQGSKYTHPHNNSGNFPDVAGQGPAGQTPDASGFLPSEQRPSAPSS